MLMQNDSNKILIDSIKRLLRRNATTHLRKIVNKTHAADLSIVFRSLTIPQQHTLFGMIDDVEQKGILFSEFDKNNFSDFIEGLDIESIVKVFEDMPADDTADLIDRLPEEKANSILEKMKKEGSDEVEGLLHYGCDTAGGIMVPDFIALKDDTTAKEAIRSLQEEYADVEMPFYLYVVDEFEKLMGVCSLRQLVVVSPDTPLKEFMTTDVFSVTTDTDQEEVAKTVARYDILAVPVVDDTNKLVGIVTVDDVIDIFRLEATEDILKMAGAGGEFIETQSVLRSTRTRLPWLFASCIGGIIACAIIGHFESSLNKLSYLAAFIPVVLGMGGNIGTQSASIVVRGLATGYFNIRDIWPVVAKELAIGVMLGVVYGIFIGMIAEFSFSLKALSLAVGFAVLCSMSLAALIGSMVPMTLARFNIDPAVASSPFVTTAIDIIGVFLYFTIATTLLGI